jgi:hypothetical protein
MDKTASIRARAFELCTCVVYCTMHILILHAQIVTLNVAINSSKGAAMVVLTSSNISELKAAVLKRFSEANTFQIAAAEVVERFQLIVIMIVISVHKTQTRDRSFKEREALLCRCERLVRCGNIPLDWQEELG